MSNINHVSRKVLRFWSLFFNVWVILLNGEPSGSPVPFSLEISPEAFQTFIIKNHERLAPHLSKYRAHLCYEAYPKGTLVRTGPSTYVPIEELAQGSRVVSYDSRLKKLAYSTVTACHRLFINQLLEIESVNHAVMRMPYYSRFYKPNTDSWIGLAQKNKEHFEQIQRSLLLHYGIGIKSISPIFYTEPQEVYLLSVASYNNFFITTSDILVHNFAATLPFISWTFGGALQICGFTVGAPLTAVAIGSVVGAIGLQLAVSSVFEWLHEDQGGREKFSSENITKHIEHKSLFSSLCKKMLGFGSHNDVHPLISPPLKKPSREMATACCPQETALKRWMTDYVRLNYNKFQTDSINLCGLRELETMPGPEYVFDSGWIDQVLAINPQGGHVLSEKKLARGEKWAIASPELSEGTESLIIYNASVVEDKQLEELVRRPPSGPYVIIEPKQEGCFRPINAKSIILSTPIPKPNLDDNIHIGPRIDLPQGPIVYSDTQPVGEERSIPKTEVKYITPEELCDEAKFSEQKQKATIFHKKGGFGKANEDFDRLELQNVKQIKSNGMRVGLYLNNKKIKN